MHQGAGPDHTDDLPDVTGSIGRGRCTVYSMWCMPRLNACTLSAWSSHPAHLGVSIILCFLVQQWPGQLCCLLMMWQIQFDSTYCTRCFAVHPVGKRWHWASNRGRWGLETCSLWASKTARVLHS